VPTQSSNFALLLTCQIGPLIENTKYINRLLNLIAVSYWTSKRHRRRQHSSTCLIANNLNVSMWHHGSTSMWKLPQHWPPLHWVSQPHIRLGFFEKYLPSNSRRTPVWPSNLDQYPSCKPASLTLYSDTACYINIQHAHMRDIDCLLTELLVSSYILHGPTGVVYNDDHSLSLAEAQEEASHPHGINKPPHGVDPAIWLINLLVLSTCTCAYIWIRGITCQARLRPVRCHQLLASQFWYTILGLSWFKS
jgi:hypothetical protein